MTLLVSNFAIVTDRAATIDRGAIILPDVICCLAVIRRRVQALARAGMTDRDVTCSQVEIPRRAATLCQAATLRQAAMSLLPLLPDATCYLVEIRRQAATLRRAAMPLPNLLPDVICCLVEMLALTQAVVCPRLTAVL
jgi:hypothetical protein